MFEEVDLNTAQVTTEMVVQAVLGAISMLAVWLLAKGGRAATKGTFNAVRAVVTLPRREEPPPPPPKPLSERAQQLIHLLSDHRKWKRRSSGPSSTGYFGRTDGDLNYVAGPGAGERLGNEDTVFTLPWIRAKGGEVRLLSGLSDEDERAVRAAVSRMCEVQAENERRVAVGLGEVYPYSPVPKPVSGWADGAMGQTFADVQLAKFARAAGAQCRHGDGQGYMYHTMQTDLGTPGGAEQIDAAQKFSR